MCLNPSKGAEVVNTNSTRPDNSRKFDSIPKAGSTLFCATKKTCNEEAPYKEYKEYDELFKEYR